MKNGCSLERSSDGGAFLVYCPREGDLLDQTAVGMMEHNRIEGLLPMQRSQLDGVWTLRYPLTGLVPGTELLTGGCQDKRRLLRCLEGVCLAFQSAEEFLLDPSLLCLEPEMIFCSPEDGAYAAFSARPFSRRSSHRGRITAVSLSSWAFWPSTPSPWSAFTQP